MKIVKNILVAGVVSGLAIVGFYLYRQSVLLKSICYDFVGIRYAGSGDNNLNLVTTTEFHNYSDVMIKLTGYKIDAFLDNQLVGKIESTQVYDIPAKGSVVVEFVSQSDTTQAVGQVINSLIQNLISQSSSIFTLKGNASIKMGIVSVDNYPIEISYDTKELLDLNKTEGEKCPPIT